MDADRIEFDLAYKQHKCDAYILSRTAVETDTDPIKAAVHNCALRSQGANYFSLGFGSPTSPQPRPHFHSPLSLPPRLVGT